MNGLASFRYAEDVRGFLSWWRDELSACVPERVKALSSGLGRTDIRLARDRVEIDRIEGEVGRTFTDNRPLEALDQEGWDQLGALLLASRTRLFLAGICRTTDTGLDATADGAILDYAKATKAVRVVEV